MPDDTAGPTLPSPLIEGARWLSTATAAVAVTGLAVALRGSSGPRPVPLLTVGLSLVFLGLTLERGNHRGPLPATFVIVGALSLLLSAEAWFTPDLTSVNGFLAVTGTSFVAFGIWRDDRRPIAIGLLQWASALGRPGDDVFRHCLVARDVSLPLPQVGPLILLGLAAMAVAIAMREKDWRVDAGRGFENVGLALFLGALFAKALELPGHAVLCGTGDAIDLGWGLILLGAATTVAVLGVRWRDRLWASSGLLTATLFSLAAMTLENNALWGLLVGAPLLGILVWTERSGVLWPRRSHAPIPPQDAT